MWTDACVGLQRPDHLNVADSINTCGENTKATELPHMDECEHMQSSRLFIDGTNVFSQNNRCVTM